MEYFVIGPDGQEYGPANLDQLRQWATEGRLGATTKLKNALSGEQVLASSVIGTFPTTPPTLPNYSQPPSQANYPRPAYQAPASSGDGSGHLWRSILYSVGAVLMFFVAHGFGMVFAVYSMVYAIQTQRNGNRFGVVAIVVSAVALIAVAGGWILRIAHMG